ncbi:MAG: rod shape-determining protein MreC [Alistipes sp.]
MYKLIEFIRSVYVVLLFIVIEAVAINYYARSSCYAQARLLSRSNQVVGGVHGACTDVKHFFVLGRENRALIERIGELETELSRYRTAQIEERLNESMDSVPKSQYELTTARVVSNSINKNHNFLVLNRGLRDGVTPDMAVLSSDGAMVGYVVECSERYAVAISILNTSFRASGKIAGSDYFGSIFWNGANSRYVTMEELSKYAEPKVGDEVVSTGFSQYFPVDIPIGTVEEFTLNESHTAYAVRIRLTVDITGLGDVILVRNRDMQEVRTLERSGKVQELNQRQ